MTRYCVTCKKLTKHTKAGRYLICATCKNLTRG